MRPRHFDGGTGSVEIAAVAKCGRAKCSRLCDQEWISNPLCDLRLRVDECERDAWSSAAQPAVEGIPISVIKTLRSRADLLGAPDSFNSIVIRLVAVAEFIECDAEHGGQRRDVLDFLARLCELERGTVFLTRFALTAGMKEDQRAYPFHLGMQCRIRTAFRFDRFRARERFVRVTVIRGIARCVDRRGDDERRAGCLEK